MQEYLNRDFRVSQNTKDLNLFAGFLKCADYGCQMVKRRANKEKYRDSFITTSAEHMTHRPNRHAQDTQYVQINLPTQYYYLSLKLLRLL